MYKPKKNKKVFTDPIIQFENKELETERELYVAVIKRAILDLANTGNKALHDRAKAWFFCSVGVTCDNFEFICDHAGVEPGYVRSFAYEVINSDKQGVFRYHIYRMLRTTK